jgi:CheY-like chemotaxis protein/anti-sigma regulatory factor (Ser/Thr protein kinase)
VASDLPPILGDAGSLEQVLMNLVVNARDAMPEGGTIRVRTELTHFETDISSFPGAQPGEYVCLTVEDEGTGMDAAVRERIFEPFFTTKPADRGTGLGLSVVYGIVQEHKGWIKVYSEPGVGSTFRVYLPVPERIGQTARSSEIPLDQLGGAGEHILVVEDEAGVRAYTASILTRHGYTVTEAPDGLAALARVKAGERFDLVFSDVIMPGLTGPAMMALLRDICPGQRALFTSGYTAGEAIAALANDQTHLLGKPFSMRQALLAVRTALGTGPCPDAGSSADAGS